MPYFDAHLHLVPDEVFSAARMRGVETFFLNATQESDWQAVMDAGERVLGVYMCLGIHPWYVDTVSEFWNVKLERLLQQNPLMMIGEIGLDATRPNYPIQKDIFRRQLQIASRYNRAVHVHCVKAWDDLFEILGEFREVPFLIHRFSGDEIIVQKVRFLDGYFSIIDGKAMGVIPDNRLLVETDAPNGLKTPEAIPDLVARLNLDVDYLYQTMESFLSGR